MILPDEMRKYNIPNSQYVGVNKYKVRSKHALFSETKNDIRYDQILEPRREWVKSSKSTIRREIENKLRLCDQVFKCKNHQTSMIRCSFFL